MAEAMVQGMAVRGNVAQGKEIRAAAELGLAVARGFLAAARAVSSLIQVAEPVAQGCFSRDGSMAPAARGHRPA